LQELVQQNVPIPVNLAMRYGNPSIPSVMDKLANEGIDELFLIPLYPHYAMSSFETVVVRVREVAREVAPQMKIETLQPFFEDPDYIEALYDSARSDLDSGYDHVLFSYHSIPVRHLRKADSSKAHCTIVDDCCNVCSPAHATCYRAQTVRTTHAFVKRAGIPDDKWSISFQSRLTREPWMEPFTDKVLVDLGKKGTNRLLVMTASFVSDCLETLEEIAIRGKETFVEAGGGYFKQIPCMNDNPRWVKFLTDRISDWAK
jgi:ferrochelatase